MKGKKLLCILLSVICFFMINISPMNAEPTDGDSTMLDEATSTVDSSIMWSYTQLVEMALVFSGNTAMCEISVAGFQTATKVTGKVILQKKVGTSWITIKTWDNLSSSSRRLDFYQEYTDNVVQKNYTYCLTFDGRVYSGSDYETIKLDIDRDYK